MYHPWYFASIMVLRAEWLVSVVFNVTVVHIPGTPLGVVLYLILTLTVIFSSPIYVVLIYEKFPTEISHYCKLLCLFWAHKNFLRQFMPFLVWWTAIIWVTHQYAGAGTSTFPLGDILYLDVHQFLIPEIKITFATPVFTSAANVSINSSPWSFFYVHKKPLHRFTDFVHNNFFSILSGNQKS